ncbi:cytochrome P450 [Immersiella caudata]|uniref:Cytochrome P450 n=1 Tax=Immersiella caudata TaxID=314043 RepID=A0AA39WWG9_9PEZI|nr:cytochrome P450 [Immersiella caudata]
MDPLTIVQPAKELVLEHPRLTILGLALIVFSTSALWNAVPRGPWKKLPPGPRGLPVLGNVRELIGDKWLTFTSLREKYGDLMYLNAAGQHVVVLNSLQAVAGLLDRKAAVSSHRPRSIVVGIMTGNLMLPFLNPGEIWHRMRRASQDGLRAGVVPLFQPALHREALTLAVHMVSDARADRSTEWYGHIQRAVAASTIKMIYGKTAVHSDTDPDVRTLNIYLERLTRSATPGAYLVEILPFLQWFPAWMSPWKRMANQAFATDSTTFKRLFNETKGAEVEIDRPSVVKTLTERSKALGLRQEEEFWLAGAVFTGAQTMTGVLSWWLMAMILYPDVQKRMHDELNRVVGRDRLPTFDDCDNMPYMQAMVRETIRWRPIDPLGLPHNTSEDIWHNGFFIPKGTMLVPNVWAINRDPGVFGEDAHLFNPARHLDKNGKLGPAPADTKEEGHVSFGFGRRVCPGRFFANKMLMINMVLLAWATNIDGERGSDGKLVPFDVDGCIDEGIVVRPVEFACNLTPRFPKALSMLQDHLSELSSQDY